jgi:hypothetical protein
MKIVVDSLRETDMGWRPFSTTLVYVPLSDQTPIIMLLGDTPHVKPYHIQTENTVCLLIGEQFTIYGSASNAWAGFGVP